MNLTPYTLPLSRPLRTADGEIDERTGFLVTVEVAGERGVGEAAPLPGWTESRAECRAALAGVADRVPTDVDGALDDLDPAATPAARHGLALAVADARARAAGVPLAAHLADSPADGVAVNATIGDGNVVQSRADAERAVEAGFRTLKVKVGARTVESDLERLWAIREACPSVDLRVDANGAWAPEDARKAVRAGSVQRIAYLEQPLPAEDLAGHADLRGSGVGVALDESVVEHGLEAVLAAEAADVVVLKPMALGGPDLTLAAAARARSADVTPVVTTTVGGTPARTAAVHIAAAITDVPACGLATADRLDRDHLAADPAPVADGRISVPSAPGNAPPPDALADDGG